MCPVGATAVTINTTTNEAETLHNLCMHKLREAEASTTGYSASRPW